MGCSVLLVGVVQVGFDVLSILGAEGLFWSREGLGTGNLMNLKAFGIVVVVFMYLGWFYHRADASGLM